MTKFDPELALQLIEKEQGTTFGEFPPMLGMLLEKLEAKNCDLSSLKHVGGIDHPSNIEKLKKKADAEFWIGFGQSETTGMVTVCAYSERPGSAGKEGPLVKIKLVDDHDREVPGGTPGEICVRGPGYFGDTETWKKTPATPSPGAGITRLISDVSTKTDTSGT